LDAAASARSMAQSGQAGFIYTSGRFKKYCKG
jgi:hypothetical protein